MCVCDECVSVWWVCVYDECVSVWWVYATCGLSSRSRELLESPGIGGTGNLRSGNWTGVLWRVAMLLTLAVLFLAPSISEIWLWDRRRASSTAQLTSVPVLGPAPCVLAVCIYPGKSRGSVSSPIESGYNRAPHELYAKASKSDPCRNMLLWKVLTGRYAGMFLNGVIWTSVMRLTKFQTSSLQQM